MNFTFVVRNFTFSQLQNDEANTSSGIKYMLTGKLPGNVSCASMIDHVSVK